MLVLGHLSNSQLHSFVKVENATDGMAYKKRNWFSHDSRGKEVQHQGIGRIGFF